MMRILALCLLLGGCADTDGSALTISAQLAEGATLCHVSAWHGPPAFYVTTNTPAACREVGGVPARLER